MLDVVLHTGLEHPNAWWVLIPSILSFVAGLGTGMFSDRVREWLGPQQSPAAD